jgi:hypothetical protein
MEQECHHPPEVKKNRFLEAEERAYLKDPFSIVTLRNSDILRFGLQSSIKDIVKGERLLAG